MLKAIVFIELSFSSINNFSPSQLFKLKLLIKLVDNLALIKILSWDWCNIQTHGAVRVDLLEDSFNISTSFFSQSWYPGGRLQIVTYLFLLYSPAIIINFPFLNIELRQLKIYFFSLMWFFLINRVLWVFWVV